MPEVVGREDGHAGGLARSCDRDPEAVGANAGEQGRQRDRERDQEALRTVRRLIELERARSRSRGLSLER